MLQPDKVRYRDREMFLTNLHENAWYTVVHGDAFECEISVVRYPQNSHGIFSLGWYDENKMLVYSMQEDMRGRSKKFKVYYKELFEEMKDRAEVIARALNNS